VGVQGGASLLFKKGLSEKKNGVGRRIKKSSIPKFPEKKILKCWVIGKDWGFGSKPKRDDSSSKTHQEKRRKNQKGQKGEKTKAPQRK